MLVERLEMSAATMFDPGGAWREIAREPWGVPASGGKTVSNTAQWRVEELCADLFAKAFNAGMNASEAVDAILRVAEFFSARRAFWASLERGGGSFRPAVPHRWVPQKLFQISKPLARELTDAVELSNRAGSALARLEAADLHRFAVSTQPEERAADPMWFLHDPILPDEVVQGVLGANRQEAARLTICGMIQHGRFRDLGRVRQLVAVWKSDIHRHLRVMASFPEAAIGPDLVPVGERVDIASAYARQKALVEAVSAA